MPTVFSARQVGNPLFMIAGQVSRGFIAVPAYRQIMAEAGHVAWDIGAYDFLLEGQDFETIHPSLQRQATLNMAYGLFEVVPDHIYQIRGFDLANITFVRSDSGWIVFVPLTCRETAAAALALRSGLPSGVATKSGGPDMIRSLSTRQFLDVLGIRLDTDAAAGVSFTINLITPDNAERFVVELSNQTLTSLKDLLAPDADLTLTINRSDLEEVMVGSVQLVDLIASGRATADGDVSILGQLAGMMVRFELGFEIMPGTGAASLSDAMGDYQVEPLGDTSGGWDASGLDPWCRTFLWRWPPRGERRTVRAGAVRLADGLSVCRNGCISTLGAERSCGGGRRAVNAARYRSVRLADGLSVCRSGCISTVGAERSCGGGRRATAVCGAPGDP